MTVQQPSLEEWKAQNPFTVEKRLFSPEWSVMGYYPTAEAAKQAADDARDYYEPNEYDGSLFEYRVLGPDGEELK